MNLALTRPRLAFVLLVGLQIAFLLAATRMSADDPFSVVVGLGVLAPLVVAGIVAFPSAALVVTPLLIVVPWMAMGFASVEVFVLAVIVAGTIRGGVSGRLPAPPIPLETVFIVYVLWTTMTLFRSVELHASLGGTKAILLFIAAFLSGRRLLRADHVPWLLRAAAFLPVVILVQFGFVFFRQGLPLAFLATRIGTFTDLGWGFMNYVAAVAALGSASAVALALRGRGADRALGIAGLIAGILVSVVTVSRGGTLAVLFILLLAAFLEGRRRFVIVSALIAAMAGIYLLSPLGRANIERFTNPEEAVSIGVRLLFLTEGFRIARENWLLGVGPDQIPYHTPFYIDANPHDIWLKQAADYGLPGLLLYVSMIVMLGRAVLRVLRRAVVPKDRLLSLALTLTFGVAVVNATYEPSLEASQYGIIFWLLMGALTQHGGAWRGDAGR